MQNIKISNKTSESVRNITVSSKTFKYTQNITKPTRILVLEKTKDSSRSVTNFTKTIDPANPTLPTTKKPTMTTKINKNQTQILQKLQNLIKL